MSFEKIGPYKLTRGDLIAAALVISFLTGSTRVRVVSVLAALGCLFAMVAGVATEEPVLAGIGGALALFIFFFGPALRSLRDSKDIYLECGPEGLIADTARTKTTYKWATLGKVRKVGSRLFIMIHNGWALVISDRSTSSDNMEKLIATVVHHRADINN